MRVTVSFFGVFRTLAGRNDLELEIDEGTTLRQLLPPLGAQLSPEFSRQVLEPLESGTSGSLRSLILLNQAHLQDPSEFDRPLKQGDRVSWVPPMEGG